MVYRAIGIMSGSSLDGLDIAFVEFHENAGKWEYEILEASCYAFEPEWKERLGKAIELSGLDYQQLHADFGHYIGKKVNDFIDEFKLHYKVALISSHGHTTFHVPGKMMTAQLGDGAAISAETGLPVVTDLRAMDIALGGQGAPIVPIGEKLLLGDYDFFLNIGGIANISLNAEKYIAYDICPANRVMNMLVAELGKEYDAGGELASTGNIDTALLDELNALDYYTVEFPKSLANDFGTDIIYPMVKKAGLNTQDSLRTYVEHIAMQIRLSVSALKNHHHHTSNYKLLATGGGAFNNFLLERLRSLLEEENTELFIPDPKLVNFKEALVMALIGVLRWRQEVNVFSSVTGAKKDSVNGALWQ